MLEIAKFEIIVYRVDAPFLLLAIDCGTLFRQQFVLQSLLWPSAVN